MSAFYERLQATAERLIEQFGKPAKIVRKTDAANPDPWNPGSNSFNPDAGPSEVFDCILVETGYSISDRLQSEIQTGDKMGIISTLIDTVPTEDDVLRDGEDYQIVEINPLNPGGTTLLYEYLARR